MARSCHACSPVATPVPAPASAPTHSTATHRATHSTAPHSAHTQRAHRGHGEHAGLGLGGHVQQPHAVAAAAGDGEQGRVAAGDKGEGPGLRGRLLEARDRLGGGHAPDRDDRVEARRGAVLAAAVHRNAHHAQAQPQLRGQEGAQGAAARRVLSGAEGGWQPAALPPCVWRTVLPSPSAARAGRL